MLQKTNSHQQSQQQSNEVMLKNIDSIQIMYKHQKLFMKRHQLWNHKQNRTITINYLLFAYLGICMALVIRQSRTYIMFSHIEGNIVSFYRIIFFWFVRNIKNFAPERKPDVSFGIRSNRQIRSREHVMFISFVSFWYDVCFEMIMT